MKEEQQCEQKVGFPEKQCVSKATHYMDTGMCNKFYICEYHAQILRGYGREVYSIVVTAESDTD